MGIIISWGSMSNNKPRMTSQRIKILEFLESTREHPSAETVFKEVKKSLPSISLATVYRNLNTMTEQGLIQRLEVNSEYRYDAFDHSHQHCVCTNTGKILDYEDKETEGYLKKKFKKKGFSLSKVRVFYYGTCEKA